MEPNPSTEPPKRLPEEGPSPETSRFSENFSLSREINASLNEVYEAESISPSERLRVVVMVRSGQEFTSFQEIADNDASVGIYKGGIGMGLNATEFRQPSLAESELHHEQDVTVMAKLGRRSLKKMSKDEPLSTAVDFMDHNVVITVMPPEDETIPWLSSPVADMLINRHIMRRLQSNGIISEIMNWSNSGFKDIEIWKQAKKKVHEGTSQFLEQNILKDEKNLTLENIYNALIEVSEQPPTTGQIPERTCEQVFKTPEEAFEYMFLHLDTSMYMGGVPDGRESLTYPISKASHDAFTRAFKRMALGLQQESLQFLKNNESSSLIQKLLHQEPLMKDELEQLNKTLSKLNVPTQLLPIVEQLKTQMVLSSSMTMLLSRLIEMARVDRPQEKDFIFEGRSGELVEQVMAEVRGNGMVIALVDQGTLDVVDSPQGAAQHLAHLFGQNKSGIVTTNPDAVYTTVSKSREDETQLVQYRTPHRTFKEPFAIPFMRAYGNLMKLCAQKGIPFTSLLVRRPNLEEAWLDDISDRFHEASYLIAEPGPQRKGDTHYTTKALRENVWELLANLDHEDLSSIKTQFESLENVGKMKLIDSFDREDLKKIRGLRALWLMVAGFFILIDE